MTKEEIKINWLENLSFKADIYGHEIIIDASEKAGGENRGPRPKPLMMTALAGCTGIDVVSILKKMRVEFDDFSVSVEGDLTEEHPKQFSKMHVIYAFKGKNLPVDKIQKAIGLSEERYCGISASYRKAFEITSEIKITD